jgi:hypothetical protein
MSSVTIITSIIILLAALVCYAFIAQTISQKKQQRERLLAALKVRVRNFKFMLNGFPTGFLPKELTLLVQRSLMQLLEQLAKLEPGASHTQDLQAVAQQMAETQRQPPQGNNPTQILENPQQVRDIKASLEELYKFIFHLEAKRQLLPSQAEVYRSMVRNLVLQLTVDAYVLHGRIARDKDKPRLAIHYFDLALKLMIKERTSGQFDSRIEQLRAAIKELEGRLQKEVQQSGQEGADDPDQAAISQEWDKFAEQSWKKKQVYD